MNAGFKKLVAAVDASEASRHAAGQALQLAASNKAELTLVAVVPLYGGDMNLLTLKGAASQMREPYEKALAEFEAAGKAAGVKVRTILAQGDEPYTRIVDAADSVDADCIVLGRGERSHLERALIGGTAARVIGYARRDVLIIPQGAALDFGRILAPTDGSEASRKAARRAIALAKAYGGRITFLTALDIPAEHHAWPEFVEGQERKARGFVEEIAGAALVANVPIQTAIVQGAPARAIVERAAADKTDCIVMGSHGVTGLKRLLMGRVVEETLGRAGCAVLVVGA